MATRGRTVTEADIAALLGVTDVFRAFSAATEPSDRAVLESDLKARLDALDADPDGWHGLKELVGVVEDRVMAGLMKYSFNRSKGQVREMLRDLEADAPSPDKERKKRRRDRDR